VLLSADRASVYYSGTVYAKVPAETGPKTFIDQVAIKTGAKERIFESNNNNLWERVTSVLDINAKRFVIASESPKQQPQQFLLENGVRKQLTNNEDMHPDLTNAPRERFVVERADGFKFRVVVNLPPGYVKGTKLPALFWFYPSEFTTQEAYDQPDRTFNKNAFQNFGVRSMEYFVRLGYAVVEPDAPIVGPAGQMNNNYVHDLRNNLAATIDELDRRGLADRHRLAIGGHSYGAFSTVNAMVHTPHVDAARVPDRAARPVDRAERVSGDVAVPECQQPDRRVAHVSRHPRSERGHRPRQLDPAVSRAERPWKDDRAVHVSA